MARVRITARYVDRGKYGYVKLRFSNGVILLEHRFAACIMLGRFLRSDEIVHHKDGNKHNNRFSNLEIMTRASHVKVHAKERGVRVTLNCPACKSEFTRTPSYINSSRKAGILRLFCSRRCIGLFVGRTQIGSVDRAKPLDDSHGTQRGYRNGCRCSDCRASNAARAREYRRRRSD